MPTVDIVKVPSGTKVTFKTVKPGAVVSTYSTTLFRRVGGGEPVPVEKWPPSKTEGSGGTFVMDLPTAHDSYVIRMTVVGTGEGSMQETLSYEPPPPAGDNYSTPVINGTNDSDWIFFKFEAGQ